MFMLNTSQAVPSDVKEGFYVTLDISQYRDDVLISRQVIEDDYILRNMAYLWLNLLSGDRQIDANNDYKFTDVDNVLRTFHSLETSVQSSYASIRLGTGSDAVVVANYKLQTEVLSQAVDDGSIWVNGNEFNLTADATIVSDGTYGITEAGLSCGFLVAPTTMYNTLVCRDVFSAINVVSGDVIVIRYIFRFNVGA